MDTNACPQPSCRDSGLPGLQTCKAGSCGPFLICRPYNRLCSGDQNCLGYTMCENDAWLSPDHAQLSRLRPACNERLQGKLCIVSIEGLDVDVCDSR